MEKNFMTTVARFIVRNKILIFLLFGAACVLCALSFNKVRINSDITTMLPDGTDTRRGLTLMENEFVTLGTADIMVSNIEYSVAERLAEKIKAVPHVFSVDFDDTAEHYASSAALFKVTFDGEQDDPESVMALSNVLEILKEHEVYLSTQVGADYNASLADEVTKVLFIAVLVIIAVLLFTSKSYFEVVILFIVFGVAAILNMGTNFWFGEISSITNSVAIILQLALAIDYAIIFCHRYQDEYDLSGDVEGAAVKSLAAAIVEISSSSLTTISGLVALTLMQFKLGFDLGMVLIKGIFFSMLTVFLLMPGLIVLFSGRLKKTRHKNLVPDISAWGRVLSKGKPVFLIIFVILIPFSIWFSHKCEYTFSDGATDRVTLSAQDVVDRRIHDTFEETNLIAVIIPRGDYAKEKELISRVREMPQIKTATGFAAIEVEDGRVLTDPYTPRAFSELSGLDIEKVKLLYALYGYENKQYQPILGDSDAYSVPLLDMFEFLFDAMDEGVFTPDAEQEEMLSDMRKLLSGAEKQLRGENYVRMIFTATVPVESDESRALVADIKKVADSLYGESLAVGDITSARDLRDSFSQDNVLVSLLTILFVFLVLFFTFRSFGASVLLILVIQGSIWINFSFPFLTHTNLFFITYLIVSAIQMGATIDYAIVIYNRFQALKTELPPRDAMQRAVNESFPTILTSGTILTSAGFIIAFRTTDLYISSIGLALGRGALISIILVLTVLPQVILYGNRFSEKTTVDLKALLGGVKIEKD